MNTTELLEEAEIQKLVLESLPDGFHLKSVDLTVGTFFEGQEPAFTILIALSIDPGTERYGIGYEITSRVRERWSRDDLYVKITAVQDSRARLGQTFI